MAFGKWKKWGRDYGVAFITKESGKHLRISREIKWSDEMPEHFDEVTGLIDFARRHNVTEVTCASRSLMKTYTCEGIRIHFYPSSLCCKTDAEFYLSPDIRKLMPGFFEFDYDVDAL